MNDHHNLQSPSRRLLDLRMLGHPALIDDLKDLNAAQIRETAEVPKQIYGGAGR